jgi:hypothetical protein
MKQLKGFMIERDIPGIGQMSLTELCGAARASNHALDRIGSNIQWQPELSGIPVTQIIEAPQIIDPLTANN